MNARIEATFSGCENFHSLTMSDSVDDQQSPIGHRYSTDVLLVLACCLLRGS
jgi:hypothetical protein